MSIIEIFFDFLINLVYVHYIIIYWFINTLIRLKCNVKKFIPFCRIFSLDFDSKRSHYFYELIESFFLVCELVGFDDRLEFLFFCNNNLLENHVQIITYFVRLNLMFFVLIKRRKKSSIWITISLVECIVMTIQRLVFFLSYEILLIKDLDKFADF